MNTISYKSLCNTKIPCSIQNLPYTVDWIVSIMESTCQSFPDWPYMVDGSLMSQKWYNIDYLTPAKLQETS